MSSAGKGMKKSKDVIGRVEHIELIGHGPHRIPAKVDTGADISSIWASNVHEHDGLLSFTLFDASSRFYTGEVITVPQKDYRLTRIANSFGAKELRYVVKLRIKLNQRPIRASFSLANRGLKAYPILLGRRLLRNKFLVDVAQGKPLSKVEAARRQKMLSELNSHKIKPKENMS